MHSAPQIAPPLAAALTDAGLLLIVVAGGVAIIVFVLFVLREAVSRPVELPRELPPAHELPPLADPERPDPATAGAERPPNSGAEGGP
jgi:hypothetical protein